MNNGTRNDGPTERTQAASYAGAHWIFVMFLWV